MLVVWKTAKEDEQSNSVDVCLAVSSILMHMQSTCTSTNSVPSHSLAHSCSFTFVVKYRTYAFLILRLILFLDLDLELDLLNKLVLVLHALLWCKYCIYIPVDMLYTL